MQGDADGLLDGCTGWLMVACQVIPAYFQVLDGAIGTHVADIDAVAG